jgi:hypothetical protein
MKSFRCGNCGELLNHFFVSRARIVGREEDGSPLVDYVAQTVEPCRLGKVITCFECFENTNNAAL